MFLNRKKSLKVVSEQRKIRKILIFFGKNFVHYLKKQNESGMIWLLLKNCSYFTLRKRDESEQNSLPHERNHANDPDGSTQYPAGGLFTPL